LDADKIRRLFGLKRLDNELPAVLRVVFPLADAADRLARLERRQRSYDAGQILFARLLQASDRKALSRKNHILDVAKNLFH
jgi:hypothetical protein